MSRACSRLQIETMRSGRARLELSDPRAQCLYLITQPTGRKSWEDRFRVFRRNRKMTLGTLRTMDISPCQTASAVIFPGPLNEDQTATVAIPCAASLIFWSEWCL